MKCRAVPRLLLPQMVCGVGNQTRGTTRIPTGTARSHATSRPHRLPRHGCWPGGYVARSGVEARAGMARAFTVFASLFGVPWVVCWLQKHVSSCSQGSGGSVRRNAGGEQSSHAICKLYKHRDACSKTCSSSFAGCFERRCVLGGDGCCALALNRPQAQRNLASPALQIRACLVPSTWNRSGHTGTADQASSRKPRAA